MICKYCHENTHYIDVCPIIICKICKDIGHPQWLCSKKKNNNNSSSTNNSTNNSSTNNKFSIVNSEKKDKNIFKIDKPENKIDENKDKIYIDKNLNHYIVSVNQSWEKYIT